jgi:CheY-like chemotaxis protein
MSELNKILYVEDEPDIQAVASIALVDVGGLTLEICKSGKEALAKAEDFNPDLLLLDVMMPEMDGPATLEALRKLPVTANTPAIFMTAKVQTHEVAHFKSIGAIDVVAKPFDPMTLAQTLREIWRDHDL